MTLSALIARVEEGTGPDRELEARVWCALGGFKFVTWDGAGCVYRDVNGINHVDRLHVRPWTSSLDAVLSLIELKLPGWFWRVGHGSHAGPWAHLNRVHPDSCLPEDEATSYAKSPARALLAATLRALQSKEPSHDA